MNEYQLLDSNEISSLTKIYWVIEKSHPEIATEIKQTLCDIAVQLIWNADCVRKENEILSNAESQEDEE